MYEGVSFHLNRLEPRIFEYRIQRADIFIRVVRLKRFFAFARSFDELMEPCRRDPRDEKFQSTRIRDARNEASVFFLVRAGFLLPRRLSSVRVPARNSRMQRCMCPKGCWTLIRPKRRIRSVRSDGLRDAIQRPSGRI